MKFNISESNELLKDITFPSLVYYPYSKIIALALEKLLSDEYCSSDSVTFRGMVIDPGISSHKKGDICNFGQIPNWDSKYNWVEFTGEVTLRND